MPKLTKKSSRRQKASQILQKDAKFAPLFTAAYFGVQAVEKPQNPAKFGKIGHRNQGVADG